MILEPSNLDVLIDSVKIQIGDIEGTRYSEPVYRTALVNGVKMLTKRWNSKYLITDDVNVSRNPGYTYDVDDGSVFEPGDDFAVILAASSILARATLSSSSDEFTNWETPDLKVASGSRERALTKLYETAVMDLEAFFRKSLGTGRKQFMYTINRVYPILTTANIDLTPGSDNTGTE